MILVVFKRVSFWLGASSLLLWSTCFAQQPKLQELYGPEFRLAQEECQKLHEEAQELIDSSQYPEAAAVLTRALELAERTSGKSHRDFLILLTTRAAQHVLLRRLSRAQSDVTEAHSLGMSFLGPDHPIMIAISLDDADIRLLRGDIVGAESVINACLALKNDFLRTNDIAYARTLVTRGGIEIERGAPQKALTFLGLALSLVEKRLGQGSLHFAANLLPLAVAQLRSGDVQRAVATSELCLRISQEHFPSNKHLKALALQALGACHFEQADYARALPCFKQALNLTGEALGKESFEEATILQGLARLHLSMNNPTDALVCLIRSEEIIEKIEGKKSKKLGQILNDIGVLFLEAGNVDRAKQCLEVSFSILQSAYGEEHTEFATCLNNLAQVYFLRGDVQKAFLFIKQSLEIVQTSLGRSHPAVALGYANEAYCLERLGKPGEASRYYATSLELFRNAYGPAHPMFLKVLQMAAENAARNHRFKEAFEIQFEHSLFQRLFLISQFISLESGSALRMVESSHDALSKLQTLCALNAAEAVPFGNQMGAELTTLHKGLLEETYATFSAYEAATRAQRGSEEHGNLQKPARRESGQPVRTESLRTTDETLDLLRRIENATRSPAAAHLRSEVTLGLGHILRQIPADTALVDFAEYDRFDYAAQTNEWKEARYAVYLGFPLAKASTNLVVERVDLGEAAPINEAVEQIGNLMATGQIAPKRLQPVLQRLGDLVYAPLAKHLTNVSHLIICPDGQLSRVPFEMLLHEGKYLVETKTISYVTSGREVVRLASGQSSPKAKVQSSKSLVMGDPDFDLDLGSNESHKPLTSKSEIENPKSKIDPSLLTSAATTYLSRSVRGLKFDRLPSAAEEARSIANLLGADAELRLGKEAREADLKAVVSPRVLHLATHGFFLSDQEFKYTNALRNLLLAGTMNVAASWPRNSGTRWNASLPENDWENPLVRCGIALAGANRALQMTNAVAEDGLLTGLEASLLNLQGTELVILSACDSGTGDIKIGEGVMSLRRAFRIAGAETVLASHWKVSDRATSQLMTEFMRRWSSGQPRAQAWREAQLALLRSKDFSNPYFWAAFTLTGQWR